MYSLNKYNFDQRSCQYFSLCGRNPRMNELQNVGKTEEGRETTISVFLSPVSGGEGGGKCAANETKMQMSVRKGEIEKKIVIK